MKFLLHEKGWHEVHHYFTTAASPTSVDLLVIESANVLRKSVRQGFIQKEQATELCSSMELLYTKGPLALKPAPTFMADALTIALSLDIPIYDALFIAQARSRHTALVTSDRRQARCAEECAVQTSLL
jgi:predicted nucleic acid-binding protein